MKLDTFATIIDLVAAAHPARHKDNLDRRCLKLFEELGEIAEAYLEFTSKFNKKHKSWVDVCEEAADVLIVALDIALTEIDAETIAQICQRLLSHDPRLPSWEKSVFTCVRTVGYYNALYGSHYSQVTSLAHGHSAKMVAYAIALNEYVYEDSDEALLIDIRRKINKWLQSGTSTADRSEVG